GRSILGHDSMETRLQAMAAAIVGFAGIILLYMVPILGIVTWALVSVFGLGAAFLSIMSAVRRERPPAAAKVTPEQTLATPAATAFEAADMPLRASETPAHAEVPPYATTPAPPIEPPPLRSFHLDPP